MSRTLLDRMEPTWPPARLWREGSWTLRDGAGGGGRVSAATLDGPDDGATPPFVMLREGEEALDARLAAAGHAIDDVVVIYEGPVAALAGDSPAAPEWPPSNDTVEMWARSGKVGPPRLAVMERCLCPKTVIACEGGAGFVAVNGDLAVLHALEVAETHRRRGLARDLLRGAATWAATQGADRLALVVSEGNAPARALYDGAGMRTSGRYYYRKAP
ncbi:GNAT family N-acetyltransferase [Falsirhodobacter sp. 20TX0035]|uniref:GNAT family N-acetyltransferase n=1 Tax=Falsirhodobacter sp. 20TX0035 TaxID=3022019 RepID=UPI002330A029|nr:GNAT family N-acetyltransferase [Falsirhodobacter sp. 20TX0035]MDB6454017.1 GNAT family N-acetyltransferase [Falsirhodobacter sp. 20TX0035]